jgi:hypothetical protein
MQRRSKGEKDLFRQIFERLFRALARYRDFWPQWRLIVTNPGLILEPRDPRITFKPLEFTLYAYFLSLALASVVGAGLRIVGFSSRSAITLHDEIVASEKTKSAWMEFQRFVSGGAANRDELVGLEKSTMMHELPLAELRTLPPYLVVYAHCFAKFRRKLDKIGPIHSGAPSTASDQLHNSLVFTAAEERNLCIERGARRLDHFTGWLFNACVVGAPVLAGVVFAFLVEFGKTGHFKTRPSQIYFYYFAAMIFPLKIIEIIAFSNARDFITSSPITIASAVGIEMAIMFVACWRLVRVFEAKHRLWSRSVRMLLELYVAQGVGIIGLYLMVYVPIGLFVAAIV